MSLYSEWEWEGERQTEREREREREREIERQSGSNKKNVREIAPVRRRIKIQRVRDSKNKKDYRNRKKGLRPYFQSFKTSFSFF